MKPAARFSTLLLLISSTASAQLTLLPQLGFEQSKTSIQYNNLSSFAPLGSEGAFKANLRLDYRFKGGHSPFIGISTSPAVVNFNFADPAAALSSYTAAASSLQWRLEGGYQYSSRPIYFKKGAASQLSKTTAQKTEVKRGCCSHSYNSCTSKNKTAATRKNNSLNMRLQPSVGMAYIPNIKEDFSTSGAAYQYKAGNWNTALVTGLGLEFGKGSQRLFTLSTYYTKGIGNLDTKTLTTAVEGKSTVAQFSSKNSSWGMTLGVPISLLKKKEPVAVKPVTPSETKPTYRYRCGSYRYSTIRHL